MYGYFKICLIYILPHFGLEVKKRLTKSILLCIFYTLQIYDAVMGKSNPKPPSGSECLDWKHSRKGTDEKTPRSIQCESIVRITYVKGF